MIIAAKRTYTMIFKHVVLRMTAIKLKKLWLWGCYVLYHSHEDSNIPILSQPQLQQWSTFAIDIYLSSGFIFIPSSGWHEAAAPVVLL